MLLLVRHKDFCLSYVLALWWGNADIVFVQVCFYKDRIDVKSSTGEKRCFRTDFVCFDLCLYFRCILF